MNREAFINTVIDVLKFGRKFKTIEGRKQLLGYSEGQILITFHNMIL